MQTSSNEDSVYKAHRNNILEKHDYVKREPQGYYIGQMKKYAGNEVSEKDADRVRGSIFNDLIYACNFISTKENIRKDVVYPALRMIGSNRCYHKFKDGGGDVFSDIQTLIDRCKLSNDRDLQMIGDEDHQIFDGVKSKVYRVEKSIKAVMVKQAEGCGIKTPDLNLYHTLQGLKVIVENEPDYILLADEETFVDPLRVLNRSDKSLLLRKRMLIAALG